MAAIPQDLLDRIRTLERQVRELSGRAQTRPALDKIQHGQVVIGEGGTLTVQTPSGKDLVYIGGISPAHADGSGQYGVLISREDGSLALSMASDGTMPQGITIDDSRGNTIFTEDRVAGGLAVPYLHSPFYPAYKLDRYATTDSGSPDSMWTAAHIRYHPKLVVSGFAAADQGTTGVVQVYVNGSPWGEAHNIGDGAWFHWSDGAAPCPGDYASVATVEIKAWRTGGGGTVYACPVGAVGVQS
ncbi:hypothetical protein [Streptomyces sp. 1331.2]|uniref:hypothetical protein n=1 Tax=Streptomyces sp. 1331.2 TaxID=1938835 RepID=UPI000BD757B0|nr:hypothetical protein [Streptomyces sp. 1331.2]SOB83130.1 hypothetical protein SAMN06272789_3328 [Streptomyces sp. 1331.2]